MEIPNPIKLTLNIKANTWLRHVTACDDCLGYGFGNGKFLREALVNCSSCVFSVLEPGWKDTPHSTHEELLVPLSSIENTQHILPVPWDLSPVCLLGMWGRWGAAREISKANPTDQTLQPVSRRSPEGLSALRKGFCCALVLLSFSLLIPPSQVPEETEVRSQWALAGAWVVPCGMPETVSLSIIPDSGDKSLSYWYLRGSAVHISK